MFSNNLLLNASILSLSKFIDDNAVGIACSDGNLFSVKLLYASMEASKSLLSSIWAAEDDIKIRSFIIVPTSNSPFS